MGAWLINNHGILTWLVPSALVIALALVQWIYGWRRLTDKIKDALEHKVDRDEFIAELANKLEEDSFHDIRQGCVDAMTGLVKDQASACKKDVDEIRKDQAAIWQGHNGLAREVSSFSGKIDEAVEGLKEAVKEIKTANNGGRR